MNETKKRTIAQRLQALLANHPPETLARALAEVPLNRLRGLSGECHDLVPGIESVAALHPPFYGTLGGVALPGAEFGGGLPTAYAFDFVYRLTQGEKVVFSTRSPRFALEAWGEINERMPFNKVEGPPVRLRDCFMQDVKSQCDLANQDRVAAANCPAAVLDGLGISGFWDGNGLVFSILAGLNDKWRFEVTNPFEASLVFEECKRSGVSCQVSVSHYGKQPQIWLKFGQTHEEMRMAEFERQKVEAAKRKAAAKVAEANAELQRALGN